MRARDPSSRSAEQVVSMTYACFRAARSPGWRRAVMSVLAVSAGMVVAAGDARAASASAGPVAGAAQAERVRCSAGRVADEDRSAQSRPAREALREAAAEAEKWIRPRVGALRHTVCVKLLTRNISGTGAATGGRSLRGGAWIPRGSGRFQVCLIQVSRNMRNAGSNLLRGLLTHEVTHCRQAEVMGLERYVRSENDWLTEGSAEYVSWKRAGVWDRGLITEFWRAYATRPEQSLFDRRYSAVGFFEHVARRVNEPFIVIPAMWRAWRGRSVRERNRAAFDVATRAAGGAASVRSWATGFMRRPDFGLDWEMQGTGLPARPHAVATPELLLMLPGQPAHDRTLAEASVGLYQILAPPGAVVKVSGVGAGKVRVFDPRSPEISFERGFELTYCARACTCPDGTDLAKSMPTTPNLAAAVAVSNAPFQAWFTAELIAPPCPPPPTDPPPPGPTCPMPPGNVTALTGAAPVLAESPQFCLPDPCEWLGVPEMTDWIREVLDLPGHSAELERFAFGPIRFPLHDLDVSWRGCQWHDHGGEGSIVTIAELSDSAALRAHLAHLERVPVADEGWIEVMNDSDNDDVPYLAHVYFRVGGSFAMADLWNFFTDRSEAIAFANAVAAHIPRA